MNESVTILKGNKLETALEELLDIYLILLDIDQTFGG
jgi:hypothetical protein